MARITECPPARPGAIKHAPVDDPANHLEHRRAGRSWSYTDDRGMKYLGGLIASVPADVPNIIFLQEMVINDLNLSQASEWIRDRYALTGVDSKNWENKYYRTTTLIDKRLWIDGVFRVHYETAMERDGLFVDVNVALPAMTESKILGLCNTHLESLEADPPLRPGQVAAVARQLHSSEV